MNSTGTDDQDRRDMARLAEGHDEALNSLMDRHGEPLFHYLIRLVQDETVAADLAQETFVRAYLNRRGYNPRHKLATWLYAIATNLARDRSRWLARHPQISLEQPHTNEQAELKDMLRGADPDPSERLAANERAEIVRQAVASLPDELRIPLLLAEFEDWSQAEIGQILGCSAKAVEMKLYRARQQLRQPLAQLLRTG
jgi:RNA polymerase sigma-70 factor (ECF subfamily)